MALKGLIFQFSLGEGLLVLKGLIFNNFYFGTMWWFCNDPDLDNFYFGRVLCFNNFYLGRMWWSQKD